MTPFDDTLPEEQDPEFEELVTLLRNANLDPMVVDPARRSRILSRARADLMKTTSETSLAGDIFAYDRQELGLVREDEGISAGVLESLWVNLEKVLYPTGATHKEAALGQQGFALLGDRYQLQEPIGRGGMATIYRARDLRMDRLVAVKVLREVYSTDPKFVRRFQVEAKAASALQHPNIVQVFDYGQTDGNYFIVMELVEGTDLRRYLRSRGVLDVDRAIIIAHDVALGLGAAHRRDIVHRDVKPQNILVGRGGAIKMMDFGIASVYKDINAERLTTTGMTLGTVQYYAPEQAQGEIVSPAADVYALGIVMYEMVTGHPPFDGDSPVAVAMQHIQDVPTPPSQVNPNISPALEEIILRCLEKAPEMRFRDGSQLARALEALAENELGDYAATAITPGHSPVPVTYSQIPQRPNANRSNPSRDDQQRHVAQVPSSLGNGSGAASRNGNERAGTEDDRTVVLNQSRYNSPTYMPESGNYRPGQTGKLLRSGAVPADKRSRRIAKIITVLILLATLILLAFSVYVAYKVFNDTKSGIATPTVTLVIVPNMKGLRWQDASSKAQSAGSQLKSEDGSTDGIVISQSPNSGETARSGSIIEVQLGVQKSTVPAIPQNSFLATVELILYQHGFAYTVKADGTNPNLQPNTVSLT
ncbi:MAG TPA: protein kinase [Ktedonobacteraceae bacterium]|nr:protein kinase [Ktedonobacteraceae bacterium]